MDIPYLWMNQKQLDEVLGSANKNRLMMIEYIRTMRYWYIFKLREDITNNKLLIQ